MAQSATTIYLNEEQRRRLFKLARERYVEQTESAISDEEARLLVHQANESIDRMARALDEAHETVSRIVKGVQKRRRIDPRLRNIKV